MWKVSGKVGETWAAGTATTVEEARTVMAGKMNKARAETRKRPREDLISEMRESCNSMLLAQRRHQHRVDKGEAGPSDNSDEHAMDMAETLGNAEAIQSVMAAADDFTTSRRT
eukprot:1830730-Rhodomonas_salina.1